MCDSTNVFVDGEAGSEATVRANLEKLVRDAQVPGRRHLLRLQPGARSRASALAAVAAGRHPVLSGRALQRMVEAAQECGYLLDFPQCIAEQQAGYLPRDKVLFICTGSQGEPRASMAKLANGEHPRPRARGRATRRSSPRASSRATSGSVGRLHNALMARGVEVITDRDADIHVSGHPARDELVRVYQWVRPQDRPAGPWRGPPHGRARRARARLPGAGDDRGAQRHPGPPGAGSGRDHRSRAMPAGWRATATASCRSTVASLRERRKLLWNGARGGHAW